MGDTGHKAAIDGVRGRLITFEGIDGAGKTSQIGPLVEFLHSRHIEAAVYREPGSTPLGEELRRLLKAGPGQSPLTELLLFAAARAELVQTRVRPDLAAGRWVILDRFTDSTLAYQGALGVLDDATLSKVCEIAADHLIPDLTLWLDLPAQVGYERSIAAPERIVMAEVGELPLDAIEQRSPDYQDRVRRRYAAIREAQPGRVERIDAEQPPAAVTKELLAIVQMKMGEWKVGG